MPGRTTPLVTHQVYHVYNKSIDNRSIFTGSKELQRVKITLFFYRHIFPPVKLSHFLSKSKEDQGKIIKNLREAEKDKDKNNLLVELYSYCFMPNHFHYLLLQKQDRGISKFMSQFQNSFTRYFNLKHKRKGSLFLDQFKAKRIETDEQFIHVQRYIHLNPYTSFLLKKPEELINYPLTSLPEYLNQNVNKSKSINFYNHHYIPICNTKPILDLFPNIKKYRQFIYDQANYQRQLAYIKHITFE